jgi:hypothetical protein
VITQTWHAATRVGSASGDLGGISYNTSGAALISYSVLNGVNAVPRYDLYTALQTSDTGFAAPVLVELGTAQTNKGGGVFGSFYHVSANTIWLAAESSYQLNIFKSTDGGVSWTRDKFYGISDRDASFNHSRWYDEGSGNLSILFGYEYFNPVTNSAPLLSFVNLIGGVWDAGLTQTNINTDPLSVIKNGSNWLVPEGGVASSVDNGTTFSHNWGGGGDYFLKVGSTVYASGSSGIAKTTDGGNTWTSPNTTDNFYHGEIIGNASLLVAVLGRDTNKLTYRVSTDSGVTWSTATTIADVSAQGYNISSIDLAMSSNGRIGLVYSVQSYTNTYGPGANGQGVYFTEFY